jgi:ABC-2 type transport system permease protein
MEPGAPCVRTSDECCFLWPVVDLLPLTYLADGLRQVMIEVTPYHTMLVNSAVLLGWLVGASALAIRLFR